MSRQLSEQESIRRENLKKIMELGVNPYPNETYPITHTARFITDNFKEGSEEFKEVSLAGRLMSQRIMGKASFAEIQDNSGRIQIYVNRDEICPGENKDLYNNLFKKLLDLGDYIGIKGHAFITQTGTTSIHVTEFRLLSKSVKPLPVVKKDADGKVYDGVSDPEFKYRQRYVDLTVNPEVRNT